MCNLFEWYFDLQQRFNATLTTCAFCVKTIETIRIVRQFEKMRIRHRLNRTFKFHYIYRKCTNEFKKKFKSFKNNRDLKVIESYKYFLKFVNYYRRFIHQYFKLIAFFIDLLKNNEKSKKFEFFIWKKKSKQTFRKFCDKFTLIFIFYYFDLIKKIKLKIDVSNFEIANIFNQINQKNYSRSITFWSRKMISTKMNYEIHN